MDYFSGELFFKTIKAVGLLQVETLVYRSYEQDLALMDLHKKTRWNLKARNAKDREGEKGVNYIVTLSAKGKRNIYETLFYIL